MMYIVCAMTGAFLGVAFMALCIAGKRGDETLEGLSRRDKQ